MQELQGVPDNETVERIVREVLAALGHKNAVEPQAEAASACETPSPSPPPIAAAAKARIISAREGELAIPDRVVTVASLDGQLNGVRRLLVQPGTILTPAVRDLLRQRGIVVTYGPVPKRNRSGADVGSGVGGTLLPVVLVTRRISAQQLAGLFRGTDVNVLPEELDCLVRTSHRVAEVVRRPGSRACVVTSQVAAGLCLANRLEGVRAVLGRRPSEVAADAAAVGANVLVADATQGVFQIKRMMLEFVRAGRECPDAFAKYLS